MTDLMEKRILIVEDEAIIALELEERLNRLGYGDTMILFSGEDAVKAAQQKKPALVIMDIGLRGAIDGLEAARQICSETDVPVIYITGSSEKRLKERLGQMGVRHRYGYIIKPFSEERLLKQLEMLLPPGDDSQPDRERDQASRSSTSMLE